MTADGIVVRELMPGEEARWDAFVLTCPEAGFFHRAGWKVAIERGLGHRTHYLLVERGGHIVGVLPLGRVKSLLFGDALISVPFCMEGGVAADDDAARRALADAACELARSARVDYLELRHVTRRFTDWPCKDALYVRFRKEIAADHEVNLKAIPRKQRAVVRKGIDAGLIAVSDAGTERFFALYSESVRNLGTPVLPARWFRLLKEVFGPDCDVLTIEHEGRAVASVLSFWFRDTVLPYYGGGGDAARGVKANDFMYWALMCRAAERGVRIFDYGRSKVGTGSYSFKKNWGFEPEPLHYEYCLVRAAKVPDINPLNPRYRSFVNLWQRLPLWASRMAGPWLARRLG